MKMIITEKKTFTERSGRSVFLVGDPGSIMGIRMHTCLFESDPDVESEITGCILV